MEINGSGQWVGDADGEIQRMRVTDVVLTQHRIAIDYNDGNSCHLRGESKDGFLYRGNYNSKDLTGRWTLDERRTFEFRRCQTEEGVYLFGTWHNREKNGAGMWILWLPGYGEPEDE